VTVPAGYKVKAQVGSVREGSTLRVTAKGVSGASPKRKSPSAIGERKRTVTKQEHNACREEELVGGRTTPPEKGGHWNLLRSLKREASYLRRIQLKVGAVKAP